MVSVSVTARGPLFDGRAAQAASDLAEAIKDEIAEEGAATVLDFLGDSLQNPTGYYESQITTNLRSNEHAIVTDQGVVYGPWLEGVSSRNDTTRFKGYASFRRATQQVQQEVPAIVRRIVDRYVRRMQ